MKFLFVLFVLLGCVAASKKIASFPQMTVSSGPDRQLTLTQTGTISVPTTYTQVSLSISVKLNFGSASEEDVIQSVMTQVSNTTQDVSTYVQSQQSVTKFHTTGISLSPVTRWDNTAGLSSDIGYQATNSVSFDVLNADAGTVIAGAVRKGSPYLSIDSVNFVACDADITAGQKNAVKNALLAASDQADFVLATLNLCVDHIVNINLNQGTPSGPIPLAYAAKSFAVAADVSPLPVSGGNQDVSATVTMTFAYKEC